MSKLNKITYEVQVLEVFAPWGPSQHMKVKRSDGKSGISWDTLQKLKNDYLGKDIAAIEFYPTEGRLVNEVNMRHLWTIPEEMLTL